jgi:hypothetical protein
MDSPTPGHWDGVELYHGIGDARSRSRITTKDDPWRNDGRGRVGMRDLSVKIMRGVMKRRMLEFCGCKFGATHAFWGLPAETDDRIQRIEG